MPGGEGFADVSVLILEDDYWEAMDRKHTLELAGAMVIGPCADAQSALSLLESVAPSCALIDVELGNGPTFAVARMLKRLDIPFAFVTCLDKGAIPPAFAEIPYVQKPVDGQQVVQVVRALSRA